MTEAEWLVVGRQRDERTVAANGISIWQLLLGGPAAAESGYFLVFRSDTIDP